MGARLEAAAALCDRQLLAPRRRHGAAHPAGDVRRAQHLAGRPAAQRPVYPDWTGETYSFTYSHRHHWYYVPQQRTDEVTLLKVYDSQTDGTARLTAHTAFDDPTTPPDAPPRRSIEVRTLVFW
jgi:hypothetical protein